MEQKQFKAESKRLLDMMIHSIYTHKEIFLRELISNASDAIDKLYFKSLTDDKVGLSKDDFAIWISADKDSRTLKITDNGIGMTEEFQKKMFETFTREDRARKIEGTGLGMSITRFIVEMMGGTIEVQSRQGEGSEFRITLDLERAEEKLGEMILPPWNLSLIHISEPTRP